MRLKILFAYKKPEHKILEHLFSLQITFFFVKPKSETVPNKKFRWRDQGRLFSSAYPCVL